MVASCVPLTGVTWPTTQACVLTGNWTSDPLVCRLALNPLSHTSQGSRVHFLSSLSQASMDAFSWVNPLGRALRAYLRLHWAAQWATGALGILKQCLHHPFKGQNSPTVNSGHIFICGLPLKWLFSDVISLYFALSEIFLINISNPAQGFFVVVCFFVFCNSKLDWLLYNWLWVWASFQPCWRGLGACLPGKKEAFGKETDHYTMTIRVDLLTCKHLPLYDFLGV